VYLRPSRLYPRSEPRFQDILETHGILRCDDEKLTIVFLLFAAVASAQERFAVNFLPRGAASLDGFPFS
jgi:hypothetical protein